ncbi:MAG: SOS response-associated peptidase [Gammaproteobacteria bacterium]
MCGRFAFFSPVEAVRSWFPGAQVPALEPHYNLAPSQSIAVLRDTGDAGREVALLRWGLVPSWAKDPAIGHRLINARAETIAEKPSFRAAFRRRRCVILANGFYEWQPRESGAKQPWYIRAVDDRPLLLAGIWEHWERGEEPLQTCAIITTAANEFMQPVHQRMPVMLSFESLSAWLEADGTELASAQLLLQAPKLEMHPVSRAVNNASHDGPDLIGSVVG